MVNEIRFLEKGSPHALCTLSVYEAPHSEHILEVESGTILAFLSLLMRLDGDAEFLGSLGMLDFLQIWL